MRHDILIGFQEDLRAVAVFHQCNSGSRRGDGEKPLAETGGRLEIKGHGQIQSLIEEIETGAKDGYGHLGRYTGQVTILRLLDATRENTRS